MRTSNKILLGTFLAAVLIITGIQVALYAKIKGGDLVDFRKAEPPARLDRYETPNIKHVLIVGMEECSVKYSDTAHIELAKNWKENLKWRVNGDSLIVEGANDRNYVMGERIYVPIDLYLPADVTIHTRYSNVFLNGANDSTKAFSRSVEGENCNVHVIPNDRNNNPVYWKKITVTNQTGGVIVSQGAEIQELEMTLNRNSVFSDEGGKFGSISARVDKTSTLNLRAESLEKIKLIKQ